MENAVDSLQQFCRVNSCQFDCARSFVTKLAEFEKEKVEIEKDISDLLNLWNNSVPTRSKKLFFTGLSQIICLFFFLVCF